MLTTSIQQQGSQEQSIEDLFTWHHEVFPPGTGITIRPPLPGTTSKRTKTKDLERAEIRQAYYGADYTVGLYLPPRGKTRFAVIDIDAGKSPYHNPADANRLIAEGKKFGIDFHMLRSSMSGGWHLVAFFAEPVSNRQVALILRDIALRAGCTVKSGSCELYPSLAEGNGSPIRLPFQPGAVKDRPIRSTRVRPSRSTC